MRVNQIDKQIQKIFNYWSKRLKMSSVQLVQKPHPLPFPAFVNLTETIEYIYYNPMELYTSGLNTKRQLIYVIFHELGHLKKRALYSIMDKVNAEYIAEKTALKWLKKYYPKYYRLRIKDIQTQLKRHCFNQDYYDVAFSRIKDYNVATKLTKILDSKSLPF